MLVPGLFGRDIWATLSGRGSSRTVSASCLLHSGRHRLLGRCLLLVPHWVYSCRVDPRCAGRRGRLVSSAGTRAEDSRCIERAKADAAHPRNSVLLGRANRVVFDTHSDSVSEFAVVLARTTLLGMGEGPFCRCQVCGSCGMLRLGQQLTVPPLRRSTCA